MYLEWNRKVVPIHNDLQANCEEKPVCVCVHDSFKIEASYNFQRKYPSCTNFRYVADLSTSLKGDIHPRNQEGHIQIQMVQILFL